MYEAFLNESPSGPAVHGFLHRSGDSSRAGLVLTHGAGSNCNSPLLIGVAESLNAVGLTVLRCDLPFRQERSQGPPLGSAQRDQAGLRRAVEALREVTEGRIYLGGHSYGGRMASMLAAQDPSIADGLLLMSYPLHPPRKPQQLRTAHFPSLRKRSLFIHGARDPFGSFDEMESALKLIPAEKKLVMADGVGHELMSKANRERVLEVIATEFKAFLI